MRDVREDEREDDLAAREARVSRREVALAVREESARQVLGAADARDDEADQRDDVAVERDRAASLKAFTTPDGSYPQDLEARRHAAIDRLSSRGDRTAAAADRTALTESPDAGDLRP